MAALESATSARSDAAASRRAASSGGAARRRSACRYCRTARRGRTSARRRSSPFEQRAGEDPSSGTSARSTAAARPCRANSVRPSSSASAIGGEDADQNGAVHLAGVEPAMTMNPATRGQRGRRGKIAELHQCHPDRRRPGPSRAGRSGEEQADAGADAEFQRLRYAVDEPFADRQADDEEQHAGRNTAPARPATAGPCPFTTV